MANRARCALHTNLLAGSACTKTLVVVLCGFVWSAPAHCSKYCSLEAGLKLVVIDQTSALDDFERDLLKSGLSAVASSLERGERLVVHAITDDATRSPLIFDGCRPGCPEGAGTLGGLFSECKPVVAQSDKLQFYQRLRAAFLPIINQNVSFPYSDIVQGITLLSHEYERGGLARLVIYSDLLENSSELPWPKLVEMGPSRAMEVIMETGNRPALEDVVVDVFGFGRSHARRRLGRYERHAVVMFWREFFEWSGAEKISIRQRY